jgi:hypothetical protein
MSKTLISIIFHHQIQSMTVPRSTAATTLFPSEAATSSQDYLVIGGDNSG